MMQNYKGSVGFVQRGFEHTIKLSWVEFCAAIKASKEKNKNENLTSKCRKEPVTEIDPAVLEDYIPAPQWTKYDEIILH